MGAGLRTGSDRRRAARRRPPRLSNGPGRLQLLRAGRRMRLLDREQTAGRREDGIDESTISPRGRLRTEGARARRAEGVFAAPPVVPGVDAADSDIGVRQARSSARVPLQTTDAP